MSDDSVGYMNSGGAIESFDLEAPRLTLHQVMSEPYTCPVCGTERPRMMPFHYGFDRSKGRDRLHDDCDRRVAEWEKRIAKAADKDPVYVGMQAEIEGLQETAELLWQEKARSLGLPEWVVERAVARHNEGD